MNATRRTVLTTLGLASTAALAGCSGGKRPGQSDGTSASAWALSGGTAEQSFRASFEHWNNDHPDKQISVEFFANDAFKEKIRTAVGSAQAPTLIYSWTGETLADYVETNKVVDLSERTAELQKRLIPSVLGSGTIDGRVYAVPNNNAQPVVFYSNRDNMAKAGVDTVPATWDELLSAIDKLKGAGIATPIALAGQSIWPELMWIQYLTDRVAGPGLFKSILAGESSKWQDPALIKALDMIKQLVDAGAFGSGYGSVVADAGADAALVHTGRSGLLLQGAWVFGTFLTDAPEFVKAGKLGYGTFPAVGEGKGEAANIVGNPANFWSVSAAASKEQQDIAFDYLNQALFDDSYTEDMIRFGSVPVVTGAGEKVRKADNGEFLGFIYDMVNGAPHFQLSWDQALPSAVAQKLLTSLGQLFLGQVSPEQFASTMAAAK